MKRSSVILFAFLMFIHWSCESPLSEQAVSDPGSIQPAIQVVKEIDYKGTTYRYYRADIRDRKFRFVELKDGGVKVSSERLMVIKGLLGTYYQTDDQYVPYALNTEYSFTVTLSDQSQYTATVRTPVKDLQTFTVPAEHDRTKAMPVSWSQTDTGAVFNLSVGLYFRTDTSTGYSYHTVSIPAPGSGSFVLPAADLVSQEGTPYKADLTIHSEVNGTIDPRFYVNSRAYSHQMITKTVLLN